MSSPTAPEEARPEGAPPDWHGIAASARFRTLVRRKKAFIVPAFVFFLVYYFSLLFLVGHFPVWMKTRVFGAVNVACLFALSQFLVAGAIAWRYRKAGAKFDRLARDLLAASRNLPEKDR